MKKTKLVSVLLSAALMVTAIPAPAFASGYLEELRTKSIEINDQLSLNSGTYYNDRNSDFLSENYFEYEPGKNITPLVVFGSDVKGAASVNRITNLEAENGRAVIGAVNGDFFDMATGVALGVIIKDGRVVSSERKSYESIGFDEKGNAQIGSIGLDVILENLSTGFKSSSLNFNKNLTKTNGFVLYTKDFGADNGASMSTVNAIIKVESGDFAPGTDVTGTVVEVIETAEKLTLSEDQMVLSIYSESQYASAVEAIRAMSTGDSVVVSFPVSPDWTDIENALGADKRLINDGRIESFTDSARNPRTALGIKSDGTVIIYTADGRKAGHSMGLSLEELAERMDELGCVDAINLDGGGSTQLWVTLPGDKSNSQINVNSEGSVRYCGDYIAFVNNSSKTGTAAHLHVYPYGEYIMSGASLQLSVKSTDSNYYAAETPKSISYSLGNSKLGSVNSDGLFTAGEYSGKTEIFVSSGKIKGSAEITVVSEPDSIAMMNKATSATVPTEMKLPAGEVVNLYATAVYNKKPIISDEGSFKWSCDPSIGTIDEKGVFTAGENTGSGVVTVSCGSKTASMTVKITTDADKLYDFESSDTKGRAMAGAYGELTASVNSDISKVRSGFNSLKLTYAPVVSDENSERSMIPLDIDFGSKRPTALSAWVYGNSSDTVLEFSVRTAEGEVTASSEILNFSGWKRISVALPYGTSAITGLELSGEAAAIYIDQLMASYGRYEDDQAPSIEAGISNGILEAYITDNLDDMFDSSAISVSYDGKPLEFSHKSANQMITASLPAADTNIHHIIIKAMDKSGNIARKALTVDAVYETADPETGEITDVSPSPVFSDMKTHWAKPYAEYLYNNNLIAGSSDKNGNLIYRPDAGMTRQEFAVVMAKWLGINTADYSANSLSFSDNSKIASWASDSVKAVTALGYMSGKAVGSTGKLNFDPAGTITRQEIMTVTGKLMEKGGVRADLSKFFDYKSVAPWAEEYVSSLVGAGIISGSNGKLNPLSPVTRAQVASILFAMN